MPRCPVCQTRYTKDKAEYCTLCGWNLNPYSLLVGVLPEVFSKEKDRIDWAKGLWATVKPNRDLITQLQLKLKDAISAQTDCQTRFEAAQQAQTQLQNLLNQREADLIQSKTDLVQFERMVSQLQTQLQQLQHESDQLRLILHQQKAELDQLRTQPKSDLPESLPLQSVAPSTGLDAAAVEAAVDIVPEAAPDIMAVVSAQLTATSPPAKPIAAPVLQPLSFAVVTVDTEGQIQTHAAGSAKFFEEPLETERLEMVAIPAGQFYQGSPEDEEGRDNHESPQHLVKISTFYMSRFVVTQAQWRIVAQWSAIYRSLDPDPSTFKGGNHPVEQVCWADAIEFCARLAQATARPYRLPSEAEWEYACRAGTSTPFYCGETLTTDLANYDGNYSYAAAPEGRYHQRTLAVGGFETANTFGLSDMHGNVWEWCADPWHENYQEAPADQQVWEQNGNPSQRLLRGGAWYCLPSLCRSAQRHWGNVDHSGSGIGFRVACSSFGIAL